MAAKVLLVDDDFDIRSGMAELLVCAGFEVCAVPDGCSAIEAMDGGYEPDAILLDYMMPKMDGAACYGILRERWPQVPVLMVSAAEPPKLDGLWGTATKSAGGMDQLVDKVRRMTEVARRAPARPAGPADGPVAARPLPTSRQR